MPSGIQYDERGRPFILTPDGRKSFISPVAMGGQAPTDETGIYRKGPQWDQNKGDWETPLDWGNILSTVVGGGLTAGVANAAMAGGAAAGGGGAGGAAGAAGGGGEGFSLGNGAGLVGGGGGG